MKGSKLESQLLHLQWAVDDYGKLKENKAQANHSSDAAIYARRHAMHLFGNEPPKPVERDAAREADVGERLAEEHAAEVKDSDFDYFGISPGDDFGDWL